jgi:hypothetical protein
MSESEEVITRALDTLWEFADRHHRALQTLRLTPQEGDYNNLYREVMFALGVVRAERENNAPPAKRRTMRKYARDIEVTE